MARRVKIAVSLAPEVIGLLDRHRQGRSRSRCVEEELLRALRAEEWERLLGGGAGEAAAEEIAFAERAYALADEALAREEGPVPARRTARRGARR